MARRVRRRGRRPGVPRRSGRPVGHPVGHAARAGRVRSWRSLLLSRLHDRQLARSTPQPDGSAPQRPYETASRRRPSSRSTSGVPAEQLAGAALVEPVRGGELGREEPGHRRVTGDAERRPHAPRRPHRPSRRPRAARAAAAGRRRRRRRCRPAARRPSAARRSTRPAPRRGHRRRPVERAHQRVDRVVDVRGVDQRRAGPDQREAAGRARSTIRPTSWVSPGPQTRCGRIATTARSCRSAPSAISSADRLRPRVVAVRPVAGRPARPRRRPARSRRARPTASRRAPAGRPSRLPARGVDDVARAVDVDPDELPRGADDMDLGGEVDDGVLAARRRLRPRRVGDVDRAPRGTARPLGRRCSAVTSSPRASRARTTPGAEHARGPGDQDPHGRRPAALAGQHALRPGGDPGAVDLRLVPDVDRQRRGRPARPRRRRRPLVAPPRSATASASASPPTLRCSSTTTTTTWAVPRGPTPTTAASRTPAQRGHPLLDADRRDHAARRDDDVRQPALDPQPAIGVEVADVAGAVPAVVARAGPLGGPQPVVAVLDVVRADADLAGHAGLGGQRPVGVAGRGRAG